MTSGEYTNTPTQQLFGSNNAHKPSKAPTLQPTAWPTKYPSGSPTNVSIRKHIYPLIELPVHNYLTTLHLAISCFSSKKEPTKQPTEQPTLPPTIEPTKKPTNHPTNKPTNKPTKQPTNMVSGCFVYHCHSAFLHVITNHVTSRPFWEMCSFQAYSSSTTRLEATRADNSR